MQGCFKTQYITNEKKVYFIRSLKKLVNKSGYSTAISFTSVKGELVLESLLQYLLNYRQNGSVIAH